MSKHQVAQRADGHVFRAVMLRMPQAAWDAWEKRAQENFRALNAEISYLLLDSLPQEERE